MSAVAHHRAVCSVLSSILWGRRTTRLLPEGLLGGPLVDPPARLNRFSRRSLLRSLRGASHLQVFVERRENRGICSPPSCRVRQCLRQTAAQSPGGAEPRLPPKGFLQDHEWDSWGATSVGLHPAASSGTSAGHRTTPTCCSECQKSLEFS